MSLPLLESRLQELEHMENRDTQEVSELVRLKAGHGLKTYHQALDELKASMDAQIDAAFVRAAVTCGDLAQSERPLQVIQDTAERCARYARCAYDVRASPPRASPLRASPPSST